MLRLASMKESTLMLLKPRMKKLAKINTKKNPTKTKKTKTRKKTTVMRSMNKKKAVLMMPVPMTKKVETIKKRPRDPVLTPILNKFKLIKSSSKMTKEKVVMCIEAAGTTEAIIEVTTGAVEATTVETTEVTTEAITVGITEAVVVIIEGAVVTTEVVITDIKIDHMIEKVALRRLKVLKVVLIKNNIHNNSKLQMVVMIT